MVQIIDYLESFNFRTVNNLHLGSYLSMFIMKDNSSILKCTPVSPQYCLPPNFNLVRKQHFKQKRRFSIVQTHCSFFSPQGSIDFCYSIAIYLFIFFCICICVEELFCIKTNKDHIRHSTIIVRISIL